MAFTENTRRQKPQANLERQPVHPDHDVNKPLFTEN